MYLLTSLSFGALGLVLCPRRRARSADCNALSFVLHPQSWPHARSDDGVRGDYITLLRVVKLRIALLRLSRALQRAGDGLCAMAGGWP